MKTISSKKKIMMDSIKTVTLYDSHALTVLEFGKVLEIISGFADSGDGKRAILEIMPENDSEKARIKLSEADEIMRALKFDELPPSMPLRDIGNLIKVLKVPGNILDIEEIASFADNLEIAGDVYNYYIERSDKYPFIRNITENINIHDDLVKKIRKS